MLSCQSLRDTDRWLSRASSGMARPLVTLNYRPGALPAGSAGELSEYLAALDDEADDGWRAFETDQLLALATQPLQATGGKALAPAAGCHGCNCPGDDCGTRAKYRGAIALVKLVARRGGAVIALPGACRATRQFDHAFHVWFECSREHRLRRLERWNGWSAQQADNFLTNAEERREDWLQHVFGPRTEGCDLYCHLSLNIDQLGNGPLIPIVGDTVLEWAAARSRRGRPVPGPRAENPETRDGRGNRIIPFPAP